MRDLSTQSQGAEEMLWISITWWALSWKWYCKQWVIGFIWQCAVRLFYLFTHILLIGITGSIDYTELFELLQWLLLRCTPISYVWGSVYSSIYSCQSVIAFLSRLILVTLYKSNIHITIPDICTVWHNVIAISQVLAIVFSFLSWSTWGYTALFFGNGALRSVMQSFNFLPMFVSGLTLHALTKCFGNGDII